MVNQDISKLNRDLSKTIIVDNFPENFCLQKENGICIKSWVGDTTDDALINLEAVMMQLVRSNCDDVRPFLKQAMPNDPSKGIILVS